MTEAVPDASALLALRLAESGAEKVRAVPADAAVSAVNFGEIVGTANTTVWRKHTPDWHDGSVDAP
jgi:PIN domain nuclease of toxin-antitoxin system